MSTVRTIEFCIYGFTYTACKRKSLDKLKWLRNHNLNNIKIYDLDQVFFPKNNKKEIYISICVNNFNYWVKLSYAHLYKYIANNRENRRFHNLFHFFIYLILNIKYDVLRTFYSFKFSCRECLKFIYFLLWSKW